MWDTTRRPRSAVPSRRQQVWLRGGGGKGPRKRAPAAELDRYQVASSRPARASPDGESTGQSTIALEILCAHFCSPPLCCFQPPPSTLSRPRFIKAIL